MARPKKPGIARHLHITPYVRVKARSGEGWSQTHDDDLRVNKALAWYDALPSGKRQTLVWELIVAAANGELGIASTVDLSGSEDDEARAALASLLDNMVMDEE